MIGTDETHDSMLSLRRSVMARLFGDEPGLETLGRYRLERAIGSGGMGTVYAAQDPELDRKVAVKLLHGARRDEGRRLLQEAKGLARLSHANVVQVYDVGTVGGRVFLAMELVEGSDLRQWLAEAPRDWTKVVETFICAGHGLAAAHAAGLVHRDFKPENVLVRDDGVVKVADFGLVRSTVSPFRTDPGASEGSPGGAVDSLTRTGTSVGTPAYMSPEQHLALDTDARTDQYSFCVALFESIYGRRPFVADTLHDLIDAARSERVVFPRRPRVPRALKRVIRRGLRARREDRYPDMDAMLRDLGSLGVAKRSWLPIFAGVGLLVLTFAGLFVQRGPSREDGATGSAAAGCDAQARVEVVWNEEIEAGLRQRLTAVDPEIGPRAAQSAKAGIDDYVASWTNAYRATCEATGDEDLAAAQRLCLTSRLDRLRGAISVLAQADGSIASSTPQIVAALEPVEECLSDLTVVRRDATLPELVFELSRASSLWHARQPREALAVARSVAERAAQAGDRNTEAEAWLLAGIVARFEPAGEQSPGQSTHALQSALRVAHEIGDTRLGLRAEVLLAWDPGQKGEVPPSTVLDELAPRVEASSDPFARWAFHCGWAFMKIAGPDESRSVHARAMLELAEEHFGAGHRLLELSQTIASKSGVTPAPSAAEQAGRVEVVAGMFGTSSRRAAEAKMELAKALHREGKLDEARARYDEAVTAWTEAEGEESTGLGDAWRRIAKLEEGRGNLVAALEAYDAAIAALKSNPAVDHKGEEEVLFAAWMGRAQVLAELDRAEEAVAAIDRARTLRHEPARLEWWGDLAGKVRRSTGDLSGALAEYAAAQASHGLDAAALERWRADPAAIHTHIAAVFASLLVGEAEVRLDLGQERKAEERARFAWDRLREVTKERAEIEALQARAGLVLATAIATTDPRSAEPGEIADAALACLAGAEDRPEIARLRKALDAIAR